MTAAYPTGGFNGFYLQTAAPAAASDATPGASDAVFVYGGGGAGQVQVGDSVRVTGEVTEFQGLTEVVLEELEPLAETLPAVAPHASSVPAAADREAHEGEVFAPSGSFTVTDTYSTNQYAEIGLAAGDRPLIQPTDVADAQDRAAVAAVEADNADRGIVLDDGASINFLPSGGAPTRTSPCRGCRRTNPVRVGAGADFTGPVVLDFRDSTWKLQPHPPGHRDRRGGRDVRRTPGPRTPPPATSAATSGSRRSTCSTTSTPRAPTTRRPTPGTCSYYIDRDGDPVTVDDCGATGPRGAAEAERPRAPAGARS